MDDFELAIMGSLDNGCAKDEFYESFEAPKYYDFVNPSQSIDVDTWFGTNIGTAIQLGPTCDEAKKVKRVKSKKKNTAGVKLPTCATLESKPQLKDESLRQDLAVLSLLPVEDCFHVDRVAGKVKNPKSEPVSRQRKVACTSKKPSTCENENPNQSQRAVTASSNKEHSEVSQLPIASVSKEIKLKRAKSSKIFPEKNVPTLLSAKVQSNSKNNGQSQPELDTKNRAHKGVERSQQPLKAFHDEKGLKGHSDGPCSARSLKATLCTLSRCAAALGSQKKAGVQKVPTSNDKRLKPWIPKAKHPKAPREAISRSSAIPKMEESLPVSSIGVVARIEPVLEIVEKSSIEVLTENVLQEGSNCQVQPTSVMPASVTCPGNLSKFEEDGEPCTRSQIASKGVIGEILTLCTINQLLSVEAQKHTHFTIPATEHKVEITEYVVKVDSMQPSCNSMKPSPSPSPENCVTQKSDEQVKTLVTCVHSNQADKGRHFSRCDEKFLSAEQSEKGNEKSAEEINTHGNKIMLNDLNDCNQVTEMVTTTLGCDPRLMDETVKKLPFADDSKVPALSSVNLTVVNALVSVPASIKSTTDLPAHKKHNCQELRNYHVHKTRKAVWKQNWKRKSIESTATGKCCKNHSVTLIKANQTLGKPPRAQHIEQLQVDQEKGKGNNQMMVSFQNMPSFLHPFKPRRSTKKLTIPMEPKFHAMNAPRTCFRHQQHP